MDEQVEALMCPACGDGFVPPQGVAHCFCPHCGKPVDIEQARELEKMLREARSIAAQAIQDAKEAQRVSEQAMADLRKTQRLMEEERIAAEKAARERVAHEAAEERARKEAEATAQAERERERLRQEQAAREATAARKAATAQERAREEAAAEASRAAAEQPTYRKGAVVRDDNGKGLFVVTLPSTWKLKNAHIMTGSGSRPYAPHARFISDDGVAGITLEVGDAGMQLSASMKATMATYGTALVGVDHTNYASMPNPRVLADYRMRKMAEGLAESGIVLVREVGCNRLEALRNIAQQEFTRAAQSTGGTTLKDPWACELTRIYEFTYKGTVWNLASYVRMYAMRDGSGVDMLNPAGLMFGIGSALGGLFSKNRGQERQPAQVAQPSMPSGTSQATWCTSDYETYKRSGTIYWAISGLAQFHTTKERFETAYRQAFLPLVMDYKLHPDVMAMSDAYGQRQAAAIQQATTQQINRMNMQTQAMLAANRQQQAAFDAQLASWQANSDAHHAAFRARTNAQFDSGYGGTSAPDYSEAIRGVNTFMTSDGREVELDVSADRAYENQAGDVIGGSGGFDPGADWNEIPRV